MRIKNMIKRLVYGAKAESETYVSYLRTLGMKIGENTIIYTPTKTVIDCQHPWMVEIGDNVQITEGVTILTHGYDWSVFKGKYGDVLGSAGHVFIGDNVFIGMNSTILKGVTIGSNVVIGANTLINKDVPSDCVVVGNPQRIVCGIDEYLEKRRSAQFAEAVELYACWRRNSPGGKSGEKPPRELFREFFWLFEKGEPGNFSCAEYENVMALCGTYEESRKRFTATSRMFSGYEEFLAIIEKSSNEVITERGQ